ncbi:hypothetical protein ABIE33_002429 [Ensifer sp. 4252]
MELLTSPSLWAEKSVDPTDVGSLDPRHKGEDEYGVTAVRQTSASSLVDMQTPRF